MPTGYENSVVEAMISYYNHDYDVFLNYLDEAVVWYGPREGQYIVGKSNLQEQLKHVNKKVTFKVENIQTKLFIFSASVYCVIMSYTLYSIHPDGRVKEHFQRVTFNGRKCRDNNEKVFWLCPYIEVSNLIPEGQSDNGKSITTNIIDGRQEQKRVFFSGENHTTICVNEASIRYIEGGKGVFSYIHTDNEVFLVHHLLKDIQKKLPDRFYRCHSSYMVNIDRISSMSSSKITLVDGTEIPVPVKRSKSIIEDIENLLNNKSLI